MGRQSKLCAWPTKYVVLSIVNGAHAWSFFELVSLPLATSHLTAGLLALAAPQTKFSQLLLRCHRRFSRSCRWLHGQQLHEFGSVGVALMKALQTLAVVVISAALFCEKDRLQCLNHEKAFSVLMVVAGFVMYGAASRKRVGVATDGRGDK